MEKTEFLEHLEELLYYVDTRTNAAVRAIDGRETRAVTFTDGLCVELLEIRSELENLINEFLMLED